LITCNRCGKENQDHYKFCLGCGNELAKTVPTAPAAAPSAPIAATPPPSASRPAPDPIASERTPPPLAMARTEFVPAGGRGDVTPLPIGMASGELKPSAPDRPPSSGMVPAAQKGKGGIPWNDSPKMPAQFTPMPIVQAPPPSGGGFPTASAAPTLARGNGSNGGGAPGLGSSVPGLGSGPMVSVPPVAAPAPSGEVICSACGKPIQPGFAFCGSCGTRVPPPAAAVPAAANPRTMFMGGPAASAPLARGRLVLIRPDGSEGGTHTLYEGENVIGRGQAPLFDNDAYLSPRHGEFLIGPSGMTIHDLRSLNGVFLKISQDEPLESGDIFRIGQELLRFEIISAPQPLEDGTEIMGTPNPGFWGRLSVVVGRDVDGSAFPLFGDAIVLGRERGDVLFPEDGYVSGSHARIAINENQVFLSDVGSSNGTFLRIRSERLVPNGAFVLMGQQLFRVELNA
jgi:pSer/pThr/pTyr-binding forkhead associated (FHA) protein